MTEAIAWVTEHWDELLAAFGAVVLAASAVVKALQGVVAILNTAAARTETKADDAALARVTVWLEAASSVLRAVRPLSLRGKDRSK